MNMLPVNLRHDGEQKQEAPEFGNQTRTDPGDRGAVPLRREIREEEDPRRVREGDGFHRKHAIRALKQASGDRAVAPPRSRIYDEAVRSALTILWEAAD